MRAQLLHVGVLAVVLGSLCDILVVAQGLGRLQDSAFGDLVVPVIVLILCAVSLGIGIAKVVNNASGVRV